MLSGTTSTTMRHPQTQSCLMQLPAELRNRIYRDVFRAKSRDGARKVPGWDVTKRAPETIDDAEWRVTKRASTAVYRRPNMLALLQTCHLVYSEAKLIPYHINALKFGDPGEFFKFLASISHEKVSTICNVTLVVNKRSIDLHDSHSPCWTALNFLPALKILRVVVDVDGLWELKYQFEHTLKTSIEGLSGLSELSLIIVEDEHGYFPEEEIMEKARYLDSVWQEKAKRPKLFGAVE